VGWDCSPGAASALRAAAAIAGHVVALAVVQPLPHVESAEEGAAEMARRRRQAEEGFAKARDELPDSGRAALTLHIVEAADTARTLCGYAREHGFDLIVVGRHGVGGAFHPRLGHVAQAAARNSEVPVLLMERQR
jgi:nucleotide-binding universal stress UspA family protein